MHRDRQTRLKIMTHHNHVARRTYSCLSIARRHPRLFQKLVRKESKQ